jgi:Ni/Co efflux regulator RcnB
MKAYWLALIGAAALLGLASTTAVAQDRGQHDSQSRGGHTQFDEHDQQVTRDWYRQHQDHPPAGLRNHDRLSPDQESRLHEGATLDKDLRKKVHPAPADLRRQLPPPPSDHRYVTVGGHVGLIDNNYNVKAVIHLH